MQRFVASNRARPRQKIATLTHTSFTTAPQRLKVATVSSKKLRLDNRLFISPIRP
jgi:hypothetical protein